MKTNTLYKLASSLALAASLFSGCSKATVNMEVSLEDKVNTNSPVQTITTPKHYQVNPITEVSFSGAPDNPRHTVLYLEVEEFPDFSKREWEVNQLEIKINCEEPDEYSAQKWNLIVNPIFHANTDGAYHSWVRYETNVSDEQINPKLSKTKMDIGQDKIVYARFSHPKEIFEYLTNWKGKGIERLIIFAHGSNESIGQNIPRFEYVEIKDIASRFTQEDFRGVMAKDGQIFLNACNTGTDYQNKLTMAEYLSWLFNSPVTGALEIAVTITGGLAGPQNISSGPNESPHPVWFDDKGIANIQWVTFTPHKTFYPEPTEKVQKELKEYLDKNK